MRTPQRKPRAFRPLASSLEPRNAASSLGLMAELAPATYLPDVAVGASNQGRTGQRQGRGTDFGSAAKGLSAIALPRLTSSTQATADSGTRAAAIAQATSPSPAPSIRPLARGSALFDEVPKVHPPITLSPPFIPARPAAGGASAPSSSGSGGATTPSAGAGGIRSMSLAPTDPQASSADGATVASPGTRTASGVGGGFVTAATSGSSGSSPGGSSGTGGGYTSGSSGQNQPPVATDDYPPASGAFGTPFDPGTMAINVLANDYDPDGDTLTVTSFTQPAHGTVTDAGGGVLVYKTNDVQDPAAFAPYVGPDFFGYQIDDGHGHQAVARVNLNVVKVKVDLQLRDTVGEKLTPAPESDVYQNMVNATGTDNLGALPMGSGYVGNPAYKDKVWVNQYEVVGTVKPDAAVNLQYDWKAFISYRSWYIKSDGTGGWDVTQRSRGGFPDPQADGPEPGFKDVTPDPNSKKIFMTDNPGLFLENQPIAIGDFIRLENQFTFQVFVTQGGAMKKAGELKGAQVVNVKKKANTGTVANDWDGLKNTMTAPATIDRTIDATDVKEVVGGNPTIRIDAHAND